VESFFDIIHLQYCISFWYVVSLAIMKKTIIVSAAVMVVVTSACGGKKTSDAAAPSAAIPKGACNFTKDNYCNEYYGNMVDKQWIDENNCKPLKTSVIDKCPTEKAIKRCVFDAGTAQERHVLIYSPKAEVYCKQPGVVEKAP
jgi:hypothetical protein